MPAAAGGRTCRTAGVGTEGPARAHPSEQHSRTDKGVNASGGTGNDAGKAASPPASTVGTGTIRRGYSGSTAAAYDTTAIDKAHMIVQ